MEVWEEDFVKFPCSGICFHVSFTFYFYSTVAHKFFTSLHFPSLYFHPRPPDWNDHETAISPMGTRLIMIGVPRMYVPSNQIRKAQDQDVDHEKRNPTVAGYRVSRMLIPSADLSYL